MRQVNVAAVCDAYGNIDHFRATASENDSAARKKLREIERDGGRGREKRERENREGEQRGNEREVSFVRDENEKEADFSKCFCRLLCLSRARARARPQAVIPDSALYLLQSLVGCQ